MRTKAEVLQEVPGFAYEKGHPTILWREAGKRLNQKIVVLDDDPTGTQTVHGISVYTDWTAESIRRGFEADRNIFFILTNSRGMTAEKTAEVHRDIARRTAAVSRETGKPFLLISRGDSTLRGHYPLEMEVLREYLEKEMDCEIDGEILCPFFPEGGRYTVGDVHYVEDNGLFIPAGETEFAKDRTFGYRSSNLKEWICEKYEGSIGVDQILSIDLETLRNLEVERITSMLCEAQNGQKIIVNAVSYEDLQVFMAALAASLDKGKRFVFRTAAAFTRIAGGIPSKPLLEYGELQPEESTSGGLIVVGSHVEKTTKQLQYLQEHSSFIFLEFHAGAALEEGGLDREQERVLEKAAQTISSGRTVVIYTSRERIDLFTGDREDDLQLSASISKAVTGIVNRLPVRPAYVIGKGGITSSDVAVYGLKIEKAEVLGQILPGVPVWKTGAESKFPGLAYVVFPGNVGGETALLEAACKLEKL